MPDLSNCTALSAEISRSVWLDSCCSWSVVENSMGQISKQVNLEAKNGMASGRLGILVVAWNVPDAYQDGHSELVMNLKARQLCYHQRIRSTVNSVPKLECL